MAHWPITLEDVRAAGERLRPHLQPTPLRDYGLLAEAVGRAIRVRVKHETSQPTGAFKVRNGVSALAALAPEERKRGVVAATRGNHGLGVAWAGARRGGAVAGGVARGSGRPSRCACPSATTPRRTRPCAGSAPGSWRKVVTTTSRSSPRSA